MSEKKKYLTNWLVRFNGKRLLAKVEIDMTEEEAAPLIQFGAVTHVEGKAIAPSQNELTQEQQLNEVINAIDLLDLTDEANTIASGAPDAKVLTETLGFNVPAKLRDQAWKVVQKRTDGNNE